MAGGDLMDVLVAEAKVIKRRIPQGAWRRACFAPKVRRGLCASGRAALARPLSPPSDWHSVPCTYLVVAVGWKLWATASGGRHYSRTVCCSAAWESSPPTPLAPLAPCQRVWPLN